MPRTLIAIGCSTDRDYAFVLPLTCLLWRDLVGHLPLALLVGTLEEWSAGRNAAVLGALRKHDITRRFIPRLAGYPYSTVAQNIREHLAADPAIPEDEWLLMSDADLWPLRPDYYQQHASSRARAVLLNANGDQFAGKAAVFRALTVERAYQTIPTCHVTMRVSTWREVYQYASLDPVASMKATLDGWLQPKLSDPARDPVFEAWMSDQRILTEKLCAQPWFPEVRVDDHDCDDRFDVGAVTFVTRRGRPPLNRLDRMRYRIPDWDLSFDPSRWIDVHLQKATDAEGPWRQTLPMVEALLPQHAAWAKSYREEYLHG